MRRSESAFQKYLIMLGIGLLIVFITTGYIYKLQREDVPDKETKNKIQADARNFAGNHTIEECIEEVKNTSKDCGREEISCIVKSKLFLKTCLENPFSVKGFCDSFQQGDEPAKIESFSSTYCHNHLEIDLVVCVNTFNIIDEYCQKQKKVK